MSMLNGIIIILHRRQIQDTLHLVASIDTIYNNKNKKNSLSSFPHMV